MMIDVWKLTQEKGLYWFGRVNVPEDDAECESFTVISINYLKNNTYKYI